MITSKAVVEHLFENHEFCNVKWCKPLKRFKEGGDLSQSYYRSKINDAKLYEQIWNVYKPFTTRERLQEFLHLFDTQHNEAMNTSISKYATKTKTYGMAISLINRVLISVGIINLTKKYIGYRYTQLSILQWQPKPPPSSCLKSSLASIEKIIQQK